MKDFDKQLEEILADEYGDNLTSKLNALTEKTANELKKEFSATAPEGKRRKLKKSFLITKEKLAGLSIKATVHSSEYRLLHLVENGHVTRNGSTRSRASHFMQKATDKILPQYESAIERTVGGND